MPFNVTIEQKNLKFLIEVLIDGEKIKEEPDGRSLPIENMCTDFRIYRSIFYHLISNAIKHSHDSTIIRIVFSFRSYENIQSSPVEQNGR